MKTTTLKEIRKANPCESGWQKLLNGLGKTKADDEPLTLQRILEINDIDDACWVADMVLGLKKELRLFSYSNALCAKKFIPKKELKAYSKIINTINLYAYDSAGDSAWDYAWASAWDSAGASARASALDSARGRFIKIVCNGNFPKKVTSKNHFKGVNDGGR